MVSQPYRCARQYRAVAAALQRGAAPSSLGYLTPAEYKRKHLADAMMDGGRSPAMLAALTRKSTANHYPIRSGSSISAECGKRIDGSRPLRRTEHGR